MKLCLQIFAHQFPGTSYRLYNGAESMVFASRLISTQRQAHRMVSHWIAIPNCPSSFLQGYNHSGKGGLVVGFLRGTMGLANAQRMLNYIRIFTEFFSQPEWKDVIVMFGIMNEPIQGAIGEEQLRSL